MIVAILSYILLNSGVLHVTAVKCPVLSRTTYKEQRSFEYSDCSGKCFQEIRLSEVTEDGEYAFLFAAGCAEQKHNFKEFSLDKNQFMRLCEQKGVARCTHRYLNDTFAGTICCENDHEEMFKSWLWDVFFGQSLEMQYELESTVEFMEKVKKGMGTHNDGMLSNIAFSFFVVLLFTALAFLQFYHINEGIIS